MTTLSTEWSRAMGLDAPIVNAPMGGVAGVRRRQRSRVPVGWAWSGDATISGRKLAREHAFVNMMDNADQHGQGLIGITIQRQGAGHRR